MGGDRHVPAGQGVEERRLPRVGETHEAESFHGPTLQGPQCGSGRLLFLMSKKTVKRKLRKKNKANHGKRPNAGRG